MTDEIAPLELPFTMGTKDMKKMYKELTSRYENMCNTASEIFTTIGLSKITKENVRQFGKTLSDQKVMVTNLRVLFMREKACVDMFVLGKKRCYFHVPVVITECTCPHGEKFQSTYKMLSYCLQVATRIDEGYSRVDDVLGNLVRPVLESPLESIALYIPDVSGKDAVRMIFDLIRELITDASNLPTSLEQDAVGS